LARLIRRVAAIKKKFEEAEIGFTFALLRVITDTPMPLVRVNSYLRKR
jgi:hypothetical protein